MSLLRRYREGGATPPFGDLLTAHGGAMEGYFWRFTQPDSGRVVIALCGINRAPDGNWATLGLAAHPADSSAPRRTRRAPHIRAGWVLAGSAFSGGADRVQMDLGRDAQLDVRITPILPWPRRRFGGSSVFQSVPELNQYWHPWLLGGRAEGRAVLGDEVWELDGAQVYGEKNWGRGGFPDSWWWGQAQGFEDPSTCVAFAGGEIHTGPCARP